jgi:diguanylate cyclase (GGDEF)-like protein
VARRLLGAVREGDTVARVGGDEFVVIVEPWNRTNADRTTQVGSPSGREIGLDIAERIRHAISVPVPSGGINHGISASIGVAFPSLRAPHDSLTEAARQAIEDADAAMYLAKRGGKNCIRVSDATSDRASRA